MKKTIKILIDILFVYSPSHYRKILRKPAYRRIDIEATDLHTDQAVQQICDASNKSNTVSRSILYVLTLACVLSLIAVLNTSPENWYIQRLENKNIELCQYKIFLEQIENNKFINNCTPYFCLDKKLIKNFLNDHYEVKKSELEQIAKMGIDNYTVMKVPIIGTAFDINNLGIASGCAFIVLLIIYRFSQVREKDNLKISLTSISRRYPDYADEHIFKADVKRLKKYYYNKQKIFSESLILREINVTRRKHHYNYLTMNEILLIPPIFIDHSKKGLNYKIVNFTTILANWLSNIITFLPIIVHGIIYFNDLNTFERGSKINEIHTSNISTWTLALFIIILFLGLSCSYRKFRMVRLYSIFRYNYYYLENSFNENKI